MPEATLSGARRSRRKPLRTAGTLQKRFFRTLASVRNLIMNDDAKPLLAARRCLRTRHISSTCTACVDMCPEEALVVKERRLLFAASKCTGCGACTSVCPAVCPTGALQSQGEGGTLRLLLNAGACTGCRLCADICFMNAVTASRRSVARRSLIDASENAFLPKERRPGVRHLGRQARRHDQRAGLSDMSALQTRPAARASAKRL